jgi:hypothetical protein
MYRERRSARRYAFVTNAEVADSCDERIARVEDLSIVGAYLEHARRTKNREPPWRLPIRHAVSRRNLLTVVVAATVTVVAER